MGPITNIRLTGRERPLRPQVAFIGDSLSPIAEARRLGMDTDDAIAYAFHVDGIPKTTQRLSQHMTATEVMARQRQYEAKLTDAIHYSAEGLKAIVAQACDFILKMHGIVIPTKAPWQSEYKSLRRLYRE